MHEMHQVWKICWSLQEWAVQLLLCQETLGNWDSRFMSLFASGCLLFPRMSRKGENERWANVNYFLNCFISVNLWTNWLFFSFLEMIWGVIGCARFSLARLAKNISGDAMTWTLAQASIVSMYLGSLVWLYSWSWSPRYCVYTAVFSHAGVGKVSMSMSTCAVITPETAM